RPTAGTNVRKNAYRPGRAVDADVIGFARNLVASAPNDRGDSRIDAVGVSSKKADSYGRLPEGHRRRDDFGPGQAVRGGLRVVRATLFANPKKRVFLARVRWTCIAAQAGEVHRRLLRFDVEAVSFNADVEGAVVVSVLNDEDRRSSV